MTLRKLCFSTCAIASLATIAFLSSCSKSASDGTALNPDSETEIDKTVVETALENEMAAAFPVGLNISSVTAVQTEGGSALTSRGRN